ncbi:MAG TPA: UDP-N-acetylmuramoyl-L-alanine--D-glutamate ligase [Mariprofundaceae bacterium]|nr:UDP-N-acetylmuramoyl-L-alanine--D-glutamate ligase [Mariprofundaceae bacterium]
MNTAIDMDTRQLGTPDTVAIIGMGRTGCSLARFLMRRGVRCVGFDERDAKIPADISIRVQIGPLEPAVLTRFGKVVVSPGIAWNHPALQRVRKAKVPVVGDLDLFAEHYKGTLIAVTGTNGKTTAVTMIATLLETLPEGIEKGGNIGMPMLDLLESGAPERVVLELSSFQLERSRIIHPKWAALLNIQPDHADAHTSPEEYAAAKFRLFEGQGEGDTALLPGEAAFDALAAQLRGRGVWVGRFGVTEQAAEASGLIAGIETGSGKMFWRQNDTFQRVHLADMPIRGRHQQLNLAVAAQAAADFGVHASIIVEAMTTFQGLEHRLQLLRQASGHAWYNDSKATNPDAAKAALESFDRVIWICGGLLKGLDLTPLQPVLRRHVERAFVIGEDGAPFLKALAAADVPATYARTIDRAVMMASDDRSSLPVLLSPAAASMDQFSNYAARGQAFADAIDGLGVPA